MRRIISVFLAVLLLLSVFAGCEKRPDKNEFLDWLGSVDESAEISFWSLYPSENEEKLTETDKKTFVDAISSVSKKDVEWNKSLAGVGTPEYAFVIRAAGEEVRAMEHSAGCVEIQRGGVSWIVKSESIYELMLTLKQ